MRSRKWSKLIIVLVLAAGLIAGVHALKQPRFFNLFSRAFNRLPPNDYARGLIYDGLEVDTDGSCKGLFKVKANYRAGDRVLCTHGPDPAPPGVDVRKRVPPIGNILGNKERVLGTQVTCDGDGVTGYRTQVMYVRASDVPDRYSQYLSSFLTWAAGVDTIMQGSAAETGGYRSVRFVHDSTCTPTVPNVVLSTTGDDTVSNTINELKALGYNRTDRKYMLFVDATVYCGWGSINYDDRLSSSNWNNIGPSYGRNDAGCWNTLTPPYAPAHELMHNLGSVMSSAPHYDPVYGHCFDDYDLMCYYLNAQGYSVTAQIVCPDPAHENRYDCNHDDYFHTNPSSTNYLYSHWNTANNQFLIGALPFPTPTPTPTPLPTPTPTPISDIILPTVTVTNPLNGATVSRNSYVTIAASATDNVAVSYVSFFVNGSLKCNDFSSPYSCNWKVSGKPNAQYVLKATAVDTSNNKTTSTTVTVTSN